MVLPDRSFLPGWARGNSMMERFDHYHAEMARGAPGSNPVPTVSQSLYEVSTNEETVAAETGSVERYEDELRALEIMAGEVRKQIDRQKEVFDGVAVPAKRGPPGVKSTGKENVGKKADANPGKVDQGVGVKTVPRSELKDGGQGPQYKYQSPAEDAGLVKAVFDQAMNGTVEVSQKELLALAPELRRQVKDLTTTKRVPLVGVGANLHELAGEEHEVANFSNVSQDHDLEQQSRYEVREDGTVVVGEDSLPLRCMDVKVADWGPVECILDSGSQIVAMRKEIWEKIGEPIRSDKIMIMEAANKTKSETMGVLENLKISVGPVELRLQVQVMKDAPYDMLLGRPFYALAQCVTKDYTSGDQYITITDPNTKHEIMIPTRDRIRNKVASAKTDFQASRSR